MITERYQEEIKKLIEQGNEDYLKAVYTFAEVLFAAEQKREDKNDENKKSKQSNMGSPCE